MSKRKPTNQSQKRKPTMQQLRVARARSRNQILAVFRSRPGQIIGQFIDGDLAGDLASQHPDSIGRAEWCARCGKHISGHYGGLEYRCVARDSEADNADRALDGVKAELSDDICRAAAQTASAPPSDGWVNLWTGHAHRRRLAITGYESLASVHDDALHQAQSGKGKERHASGGESFADRQIVQLGEWMGSTSFAVGQACKKALESTRLPYDRARAELLGAINYLSAAVIQLDRANRVVKADDVAKSHYAGDSYEATIAPDPKAGKK